MDSLPTYGEGSYPDESLECHATTTLGRLFNYFHKCRFAENPRVSVKCSVVWGALLAATGIWVEVAEAEVTVVSLFSVASPSGKLLSTDTF